MIDTNTLLSAVETDFPQQAAALDLLLAAVTVQNNELSVQNPMGVSDHIGVIAYVAAFGSPRARLAAHEAAWNIAAALGIYCASIDSLYRSIAAGELAGVTVPAINIRAIAFQSARGVFQAMNSHNVKAAIFELSRGEIGFTGQRPREYATVILCAAIAEGYTGPVFLQGDHFQVSATRYREDPVTEIAAVKSLIAEAISAGFYNIDIDTSTLVDLSFLDINDQQKPNYTTSAELAAFTRSIEPAGITISLGGEIGEVGEHNSTVEELDAYLSGYNREMAQHITDRDCPGLAKISVQTGTRHGGNILADGSIGEMEVDFNLITRLSARCRSTYGLAGCVQHGASMLSLSKISRLPQHDCVEVHLAAAFLNVVYDHLPEPLVEQADDWIKATFADEWKSDWSEPQFIHHGRRYPVGPNKRAWWDADPTHNKLRAAVCQKAEEYFSALNALDTAAAVMRTTSKVVIPWTDGPNTDSYHTDETTIDDLAS
ncbi:MAG: hypothetical protein KTR32_36930 [Granulosicoccus sp.]|nr:hypothetical protein [Granulosicoccus sp.]